LRQADIIDKRIPKKAASAASDIAQDTQKEPKKPEKTAIRKTELIAMLKASDGEKIMLNNSK